MLMTISERRKRSNKILSVPTGKESHSANFAQQFKTHSFMVSEKTARVRNGSQALPSLCSYITQTQSFLKLLMLPQQSQREAAC